MAVLLACLEAGDTFMGLNLDHGGHLSHGSLVNSSGILYKPVGYNLSRETGMVDYDEMEQLARQHKPKLLIAGGSAYSREWDYERMRKIADEVGAIFMVDMAHPAGLIAAFYNPIWASTIKSELDFVLASSLFVFLVYYKLPSWSIVLIGIIIGIMFY